MEEGFPVYGDYQDYEEEYGEELAEPDFYADRWPHMPVLYSTSLCCRSVSENGQLKL